MKKVSKFLSMFLLVVMCFSLFSTAAYANGEVMAVLVEETSNPWQVVGSDVTYATFNEAYKAVSSGGTIRLVSNKGTIGTGDNGYITINNKNITIDLNGNKLVVDNTLNINANVNLSNGTIKNPGKIQVIGGTLTVSAVKDTEGNDVEAGDFSTSEQGKVVVSTSVPETAAVAKIGNVYYSDIDEAFEAAAAASDQSVTLELTKSGYTYTLSSFPTNWKCNSLTLNVGNNILNVGTADFGSTSLTVNGSGTLNGTITVNKSTTLNIAKVTGSVIINGATLTVNGSTVDSVSLNSKSTLSVPSTYGATIKTLTLDGSANTLNVGAGTFGSTTPITFWATHGTAGIYDGIWYVDERNEYTAAQNVTNFEANIMSGYTDTKENNYYVVGKGSKGSGAATDSTVISGTTISSGTASGDNFTYTATTSGDVSIWPADTAVWVSGDGNLYFKYTPNTATKLGYTYSFYMDSTAWIIPGQDYTDDLLGNMSLGKSFLAGLSEGTHTLILQMTKDNVTYKASCTFYVGASLKAVDTNKHVINSTKTLQFVCSQPISRVWVGDQEITSYNGTYYTLSSNRKTITLSADFLNARTAGSTYTLTVKTDGGDTPSATFQILTTAQASSSPKTGDSSNLALWAAVLVLSGGAAVAVLPRLKKNEG